MAAPLDKVPGKAWVVTFAGTAINLCLGILYAWSVWGAKLTVPKLPDGKFNEALLGTALPGINSAWTYLSNAQVATPFSLCVVIFALLMIPGGRIQDKYGPKVGATLGGLFLAAGCIVAGLMKSYEGLIIGFGVMGGIGMGIGYAAPTPAALKWFGPHKRGLVAGLVVGGYGGAALYIAPLARWLIGDYGLSRQLHYTRHRFRGRRHNRRTAPGMAPGRLCCPRPAPAPKRRRSRQERLDDVDWPASDMIKTWQFYRAGPHVHRHDPVRSADHRLRRALWLRRCSGSSLDAGLLRRARSTRWAGSAPVCTPTKSAGRTPIRSTAWSPLCASSRCPPLLASKSVLLLFLAVGIAYWQYGGGLALMPSFTADFFGPKNLGFNYGLVFIGWGLGFFMARLGGTIRDITGSLNWAFYLSGIVLIIAVILARVTKRPSADQLRAAAAAAK